MLRVQIATRTDVLNGKTFGAAGAYERITGRVYFSLPVANPHNQRIVDLGNAVNLKNGEVEFSSDFIAIRPKDAKRGNGSLLLEVPNRGNSRIVALVDGGDWDVKNDAGDAWLLRNGYTFVSVGWQWDAQDAGALRFFAPIAEENGKTIYGLLRGDLMPTKLLPEIPLGHLIEGRIGGIEYPVAAPDDPRNVLTVRDSRDAPRTLIPHSEWQFAHTVDGKVSPNDRYIHLNGGFQPGKIYEYVYVVANPVVAGGGFAAIRDFAAYAKHDPDSITPAQRVYGEGISQNGRFLRDFLYEGFNADEEGRMALDGVLAHVAGAGRGSFNYRFAQPSRDAQPTSSVFFPTDIFPFTDQAEKDSVTRMEGGLLEQATADKAVPKIFLSNTSYEYWGRVAALIHISADGKRDASLSDNVRIYHFTGLQHFPGPFPPQRGTGDLLGQRTGLAAPHQVFLALHDCQYRRMGTQRYLAAAKQLPQDCRRNPGAAQQIRVPRIAWSQPPARGEPGVSARFWSQLAAGNPERSAPKVGPAFPVLVPQVDSDGNERDGVRLPEISVPLATYTGWNLRDPSIGAPVQRVAFEVSYLPFSKTAAEREKTGDPRKSIAERYADREDYLARYEKSVDDLVKQRWILPEDRAALLRRGELEWSESAK